MDEIAVISISISIASLGIFCLFFNSNDDDDQDGGQLIKSLQNISWFSNQKRTRHGFITDITYIHTCKKHEIYFY